MIEPHVQVGVTTGELDRICHEFITNGQQQAIPAPTELQRLPPLDLHLNQRRGVPRHPLGYQETQEWRYRQHRCDGDQGRIPRRLQHHGAGGQCGAPRPAPGRGHPGVPVQGPGKVRPGATLGDIGHVIQQHAEKKLLLGSARVLRPRHRQGYSTKTPRYSTTATRAPGMVLEPGMTFTIEPMINAGRRQYPPQPEGRLDGYHPRWPPLGPMGAHPGCHRGRLRGFHTPQSNEPLGLSGQ